MSLRSVYWPAPSFQNDRIHITGDEHRHLFVARVEKGETLEVFDGNGSVWTAVVESVSKRETIARASQSRHVSPPSLELILAMSMIRIPAFELALEKAVEVGVTRIVPFTAARSNVGAGHRHDRWMRIIIEAAKQSKILFAERGGGPLKPALAGSPVLYLIGPEGGWTDEELTTAGENGFQLVSLGAALLKAETAAIVGAALIRYEFGL